MERIFTPIQSHIPIMESTNHNPTIESYLAFSEFYHYTVLQYQITLSFANISILSPLSKNHTQNFLHEIVKTPYIQRKLSQTDYLQFRF